MKKKYLISTLLLAIFAVNTAFSQAKETTGVYQKTEHPAFTIHYNQAPDIITGAIKQRLKQDDISSKTSKGVTTATGVNYPSLAHVPVDLYFVVEGKGRKGRDGSFVTLFISKGKDNFISSKSDPDIARNAMQYLNNLQQNITVYSLQQQINQQQKVVDGEAKDYRKLLKTSRKLQSKRYDLQKNLSGETDPSKQDKLRNKIQSLDKKINRNQSDIKSNQRDLMQAKDQLSFLQQQLSQQATQVK